MKFSKNTVRGALLTASLSILVVMSSCLNIFDPIDNPGGDEQIMSAARAAFDRGDLQEARDLYAKLGTNETAVSEAIFTRLDECGADIGAFGAALGGASGNPGLLITVMAEKMNARHGTSCLATLLTAYKNSQNLTDVSLKGFTGFLAAIAVAGEVLAHNSRIEADGELNVTDIVSSGAAGTCTMTGPVCGGGCSVSDGISAAATTGNLAGYTTITPTWGVLQDAITAANTGLTQLGISSGPSATLITGMGGAVSGTDNLYRCALHDVGVGR